MDKRISVPFVKTTKSYQLYQTKDYGIITLYVPVADVKVEPPPPTLDITIHLPDANAGTPTS